MSRNKCFFFRSGYHMFQVLYPFVTYLLTLPRIKLPECDEVHQWYKIILWRVGGYASLIRRFLVRMIGFISVSYTRTLNYTYIQAVHNLPTTVAHALGFL
jgi:hypothetical protein